MELCALVTPVSSLLFPVKLPQCPSIREVPGGQSWAGTHSPFPNWDLSVSRRESSRTPPRPRGAEPRPRGRWKRSRGERGGRGSEELAAEGTADCAEPMETAGRGGTKFPSANDAPESTEAISISPGAGAVAAGQRCVCSTQFLRGQPLARLGSVSSPLRTAKPTLRTLPPLAANKRV